MDVEAYIFSYLQDGCSPLYWASANGHTEVVDILLKNGADYKLVTMVWSHSLLLFWVSRVRTHE